MSISSIMSGLASLSVTYGTDSVKTWTYDSMFDTLNESDCPVRMIGRLSPDNGATLNTYNLNNKDMAEWRIVDSLYAFPVPLDKGIENANHALWNYIDSYMTQISSDICLGSAQAFMVTNVEFREDVRPYPNIAGAPEFWVIDAIVTVEEWR